MKKILLLGAIAFGTSFAADLRFSTDGTYPPFSEINQQGQPSGFDIDLGNALCEQMQRKCTFSQIDWDGLIPALKSKKTDLLVASMNATEERAKSIAFSDPYYVNPGITVRAVGSKLELSEEGLKGKTIGVLRASTFDNYATDKWGKWANIQRYNSQEEANLDAVAGRVDVLFADKVVLEEGFLARLGKDEQGKFEQFGAEIDDEKYFGKGISIGVRKEDTELLKDVNAALKAIKENGTYKKINDKYFKTDISGGTAKAAASSDESSGGTAKAAADTKAEGAKAEDSGAAEAKAEDSKAAEAKAEEPKAEGAKSEGQDAKAQTK